MEFQALVFYFGFVIVLVCAILAVSHVLGQRHREPRTDTPFESGIVPSGSARVRLSVEYYPIALLFVIFDLEAVFLYAWAVAGKSLGWAGFWGAVVFVGVLIAVLLYEWRLGALDWGTRDPGKEID